VLPAQILLNVIAAHHLLKLILSQAYANVHQLSLMMSRQVPAPLATILAKPVPFCLLTVQHVSLRIAIESRSVALAYVWMATMMIAMLFALHVIPLA
jgi:hypothetical protein